MFRKALFLPPALMSLPIIAQAHDGHGFFHGHEFAHYISSAEHAIPLALIVAASVLLVGYRRWSRRNV